MSNQRCGWCGKEFDVLDREIISVRVTRKSVDGQRSSSTKSRICKDCEDMLNYVVAERSSGRPEAQR